MRTNGNGNLSEQVGRNFIFFGKNLKGVSDIPSVDSSGKNHDNHITALSSHQLPRKGCPDYKVLESLSGEERNRILAATASGS